MHPLRHTHLLLPLLAMGATFALASPVRAQHDVIPAVSGASASLRITFGSAPHWAEISGTHIAELPRSERPDDDLFRFEGRFYAFSNDRWYESASESGEFAAIAEDAIPVGFSDIPRDHWRHFPSGWEDDAAADTDEAALTLQVAFTSTPHWNRIAGMLVDELAAEDRREYDLFRLGDEYYAFSEDQWYSSNSESGEFTAMDDPDVPAEFSAVPREHWQSYPSAWEDSTQASDDASSATMQVAFSAAPHWIAIRGMRIDELAPAERQDYDMFRFGVSYYAFRNDQWYTSSKESGDFIAIDGAAVPAVFADIPREHWRSDPSGWLDDHDDARRSHWHSSRFHVRRDPAKNPGDFR